MNFLLLFALFLKIFSSAVHWMVHNDSPDKCSNKKKKQLEKTEVFIRLLPIYHENLKNHLYNNYDISIFRPLLCREIIEFRFS